MRRNRTVLTVMGLAVLLAGPTWGQQDATELAKNKLLAKRAAEADAYRKLGETIRGLTITSETSVRDFVTESDVIETEFDDFVKGARFGEPYWYEDGSCEIDAEVTVAKLITHLKEIHTRHYRGDAIKGTDFEKMTQTIKKNVIKVTGMGAPRPDIPALPPVLEAALPPPPSAPERAPIPALWLQVGPKERLKAHRAAEVDALRKLLERVRGLRVTSDTKVSDFTTEWDKISLSAKGYLVGAYEIQTYYHQDEPIVEVTYAMPVEQVITTIKKLHQEHYKGDHVTGTDIVNIKKQVKNDTFQATGMGVPDMQIVRKVTADAEVSYPDWSTEWLRAVGQGTDPDMDTPQGKLKAARAAEVDAKRKLAERIYGLSIVSNTQVRDFVTERDEIAAQMASVLEGALIEKTEFVDGVCEVTVAVKGMEIWTIINEQMTVERRGNRE